MIRTKFVAYWVAILLATVLVALLAVTFISGMQARQDADKQLSQSRAAATRRIDLLTQEIKETRSECQSTEER